MILRGRRRRSVIVETAVLIVGKKYDGILPVRTVANCADYLGDEGLAALDICGRMLVIFGRGPGQAEIWIDERNRRQCACCGLNKKSCKGQEVRINARGAENTEAGSLRGILEIIGPGNAVFIEQVENRSGNRLVTSRRGKRIVRRQMPE